MNKVDKALTYFKDGFNCSQAVFSVYHKQLGLSKKEALKMSSAFGGGIARNGNTCGVVTGALMVIGSKYGKFKKNDKVSKEKTYTLCQEFIKRFNAKNNSVLCKDLLGYDVSTPKGFKMVNEKDLHNKLCTKFIRDAIQIIEKIL